MHTTSAILALLLPLILGCAAGPGPFGGAPSRAEPVTTRAFGSTQEGLPATVYTLRNASGVTALLTDFGATLVSMRVPDRGGRLGDVVLGFDSVEGYESAGNQFFGCTAGRVANRVADARFELDGEEYTLAANNAPHSLHGGERGFGQRLWTAEIGSGAQVTFRYTSEAGEEGYPGTLRVSLTYTLTDADELILDYSAETDAPTLCNLTHHSYFNLAGHGAQTVLDHELRIGSSAITPADETLIPDGSFLEVEGTPFDFREAHTIGERIAELIPTGALGYDHNYVLEPEAGGGQAVAAELHDPGTGRTLEIRTDQPGLQFYSGNFLEGQKGKAGLTYAQRSACCLETQAFPAAPSHDHFPSIVLRPGETYTHRTSHRFFVR